MRKTTSLLVFLTVIMVGFTQENQEVKPNIEVVGTANKEIIPNEIYLSIRLKERMEGREKVTIEAQEEAMKNALIVIGIDLKNLSLSDANAGYIKVNWTKKDVIALKEYTLMVENASVVGKVFEQLDALKIDDVNIDRVDHSEMDKFREEVKIEAIKAAKRKADYLLEAIGHETGRAVHVYENQINNLRQTVATANYYIEQKESYGSFSKFDKSIQFEKIQLQASIYVKFEIK